MADVTAIRPEAGLKRSLGLLNVVLYGIGVTVGAGIYVLIGAASAEAGMAAPVSFLVAAVLMGLSAFSFAELATRMPVAAGEAAYVREGFRSNGAALAVGALVIAIAIVSAAAISVGASGYVRVFLPLGDTASIVLVVLAMGAVAAWGIKESVTAAGVMTMIEVGGLLVVIGAGLIWEPGVVTRLPEAVSGLNTSAAFVGLVGAGLLAVFAFIGFEGIVNVAEEIKDPVRVIPKAILITLAVTTLLYVAVVWVALVAIGPGPLAQSKAPLALVFERLTGASQRTMAGIAIIATLNGIIVQIILGARVVYGLADQGNLPRVLAQVSPVTQTPLIATGVVVAATLAFAVLVPLGPLAEATSRLALVLFVLVNVALVLIKRREAAPPPGIFEVPGWVPVAGAGACILFLVLDLATLGH